LFVDLFFLLLSSYSSLLIFKLFKLFMSLFIYHIMFPDPRPAHPNNIKKNQSENIMFPAPPNATQPALSMRKPRELSQFGKKSAKVYRSLYSSTEQLQVAL
jgi:hypothetical protein